VAPSKPCVGSELAHNVCTGVARSGQGTVTNAGAACPTSAVFIRLSVPRSDSAEFFSQCCFAFFLCFCGKSNFVPLEIPPCVASNPFTDCLRSCCNSFSVTGKRWARGRFHILSLDLQVLADPHRMALIGASEVLCAISAFAVCCPRCLLRVALSL